MNTINKYSKYDEERRKYLEIIFLDFLNIKIQKYERKIYEWCYKDGSTKVFDRYKLLWNNEKIWRKGLYYIWLKNEVLDLNYDINTKEYLTLEKFTLHHEPYIWEHLLTKGVYPINKNNHTKGRILNNNQIKDIFENIK